MNILKQRVIPGILFTIFIISFVVIGEILGSKSYEIRIICYLFVSMMTWVIGYELFKAFRLPKWVIYILPFAIILCIFMPINTSMELLRNIPNQISVDKLKVYTNEALFNWVNLIIFTIITLLFLLIELSTRVNMTFADRIIRALHIWFSLFFITNSMIFLLYISFYNWQLIILLFGASVVTDTGGFFGGLLFGKKWINLPFAPNISPKKTWEGFIVGVSLCLIFSASIIFGFNLFGGQVFLQIIAAIIAPLAAVIGDLYFSYLKRLNAVKDYSKILLAHGGILDRFDSLCVIVTMIALIYKFV
ncbi:phosphatidate cytidylyltransferase [Mycoplasma tauri]|uniref:phosphatidate cytidylyltransferase n=1 Tax=Mycoplasma tauri TaxID=547987 RepID=UPI001CBCFAD3|nr:phosphatidate cytidylyltransferase [Mycoplasma tauri]MBZ4226572.1 phosphatidate cytidylyltransferase [Mycoplasma tauri]